MQSIDLEDFAQQLDDLVKKMPQKRRELHETVAKRAQEEVRAQIRAKLNDGEGHVQGWQEASVGSGGGYGKVKAKTTPKGVASRDSPGAITNYLENGHKTRRTQRPDSERSRYEIRRSQNSRLRVEGRKFYAQARKRVQAMLNEEAEKLVQELAKEFQ